MAKIDTPDEFTYSGWCQLLGLREERKIGHNTHLVRMDDGVGIVYHHTPVVEYGRNGGIWLNFGGWPTSTTRDRMNQCLPARFGVVQHDGAQYLLDSHANDKRLLEITGVICIQRDVPTSLRGVA